MTYSVEELCSQPGLQLTFEYLLAVVVANATITYGDIAHKLQVDLRIKGKVFPTHIGHVVGRLMQKILEVENVAPLINVLVVNQNTGQPGEGADEFIVNRFDNRNAEIVARAAKEVYVYAGWRQIYRKLFKAEPPHIDPDSIIKGTEVDGVPPTSTVKSQRGGAAESEEHKRLKQYVYDHPRSVGASAKPQNKQTEQSLLSGDEIDVFFEDRGAVYLIEVKSIRSSDPDLKRGVYQCIKYRAVFAAQRPDNPKIIALLVTETNPSSIRELARRNDVRIVSVNRKNATT